VYKKGTTKIKTHFKQEYTWNDTIPKFDYFKELKRVSKRSIIWGANYYNVFNKGGALVWYKNPGFISQLSQCEIAALSWKKQIDYVHIKKLTGFLAPIKYIHPCEKPIALYKWLLKNYAKEGNIILDTHVGSASSLIACIDLEYKYIGFELDKDYYNDAVKRIENHKKIPPILWKEKDLQYKQIRRRSIF